MKRGLVLIALILSLGLSFAQGTEPAKPQLVEKPFFKHPLRTPLQQKYHEWAKHQLQPGYGIHPTIGRTMASTCATDDPSALPHAKCIVLGLSFGAHY
jgi:hypothetical protein